MVVACMAQKKINQYSLMNQYIVTDIYFDTATLWTLFVYNITHWGQHKMAATLPMIPSNTWWRHQLETFSALLAICAGPAQRPVTRSFDVFFDLRLNQRLSKQWRGWWFETLPRPVWRHCNDIFFVSTALWPCPHVSGVHMGPLLLTWCNFNPSMDK